MSETGLLLPPIELITPTETPTETSVSKTQTIDSAPAVATAPDVELESSLTDLALAARVLGNLSTSLEVVLDRLTSGKVSVEPASTTVSETVLDTPITATTKLSAREQSILNLLLSNAGRIVTKSEFRRLVGSVDISSDIARIRKHGHFIESSQTIRRSGEKVPSNITGYRLSTPRQANQRARVSRARNEVKEFLVSLITEAFSVS